MYSRRAALLIALAALGAGCEVLASSDVYQCSTDGDCAARGASFAATTCVNRTCVSPGVDASAEKAVGDMQGDAAGDAADASSMADAASDSPWGCLGQVAWLPQSATETVLYRNRFVQLSSRAPVTGLQVTACGSLDPQCLNPVTSGTTDDDGYINLTVPQYFRGFFLMDTPPSSYPDMVPALIMALPPPSISSQPDASVSSASAPVLPASSDLDALLSVIGRSLPPPDAGFGQVLGLTTDCQGNPVSGVSIQSSSTVPNQTLTYYIGSDGVPSLSDQQTSAAGQCGFVNLPEGDETITMALFGQGQSVGQATLLVRSGFVTISLLPPSP